MKYIKHKHIILQEHSHTRAWQVRIQRKHKGKEYYATKLFSYSKHGGKEEALKVALEVRDLLVIALPVGCLKGIRLPHAHMKIKLLLVLKKLKIK